MKIILSLCFAVLLAAVSVSSTLTENNIDIDPVTATSQQQRPPSERERYAAEFQQYLTYLDVLDLSKNQEIENDELGPNFNQAQFLRMLKLDSQTAFRRRCKKITGDDNSYTKAMEAKDQAKTCIANWEESEEIMESYYHAKMARDPKIFIKKICTKRSEFFGCIDTNSEAFSQCFQPSEIKIAQKAKKTLKNLVDLICSKDENEFAFYGVNGVAEECMKSKEVEIMTCANEAIYLVAKRILEKWIENEHFKFETEAEDCMTFNAIQRCFESSVKNCTSPKVRNMVSSGFDVLGEQDIEHCIFLIFFGSE